MKKHYLRLERLHPKFRKLKRDYLIIKNRYLNSLAWLIQVINISGCRDMTTRRAFNSIYDKADNLWTLWDALGQFLSSSIKCDEFKLPKL